MSSKQPSPGTARRAVVDAPAAQAQIMAAVDELFYQQGARAVGVDAVVKRAGVNKMALYRQFQSKDALLVHYVERREANFWSYINASIAMHPGDARQQLLQVFSDLAQRASRPGYRGCPFVNIAVEFPDREHPTRLQVAKHKTELLARFLDLATQAGATNPQALANGLALLIEGAYAASQTYAECHPLLSALPQVARTLLDAAIKPGA